jgi:DNA-directed RNA polymerase subunit beta'
MARRRKVEISPAEMTMAEAMDAAGVNPDEVEVPGAERY